MKQKLSITLGITFFTAIVTGLALAEYSQEVKNAYDRAFNYSITTQPSIEDARLDNEITRQAMAKMIVNFSKNVLGNYPDPYKICEFEDPDITEDLQEYVKQACQLGLMGQNTSVFKPHDSVTKAQFGVMLSRALWGQTYEGSEPYYLAHLTALQEAGILDDISNPTEQYVTRREVITTLKKSSSVSGIGALSIGNNENEQIFFDAEIEGLMTEKGLSDEQKKVIRNTITENETKLLKETYEFSNTMDDLDLDFDDTKAVKNFIDSITKLKDSTFDGYMATLKNIYKELGVDIDSNEAYTPGEKLEKLDEYINAFKNYAGTSIDTINYLNVVYHMGSIGEDGSLVIADEEKAAEIWSKMAEYEEAWEKEYLNFNTKLEEITNYLITYKTENKYWKASTDDFEQFELSYKISDAELKDGVYFWKDGSSYVGGVKNGKFDGVGSFSGSDGIYYSGNWSNNMFNGLGELIMDDYHYVGNFANGFENGYGYASHEDEIYTGEWKDGVENGFGIKTQQNNILSGYWSDGYIKQGTFENIASGIIYSGSFKKGIIHGNGVITYSGGITFSGEFSDGDIYGKGILSLADGTSYSGDWKYGYLSGENIYLGGTKVIFGDKISIVENPWNNTIIISDGVDNLTMMDKNLGASETGTGINAYGYLFKWGNNNGFSALNTSDTASYQTASTGEWKVKDQGPCPSGYHIPTEQEWQWVIDLWSLKNKTTWKGVVDSESFNAFTETFKLPLAGMRRISMNTGEDNKIIDEIIFNEADRNLSARELVSHRLLGSGGMAGYYWLSDKKYFELSHSNEDTDSVFGYSSLNNDGYAIRCFKD